MKKTFVFLVVFVLALASPLAVLAQIIQQNTNWQRVVDEAGHFYDGFYYTDHLTGEQVDPDEYDPDFVGPDIGSGGGSWRVKDHLNFYGVRTYEIGSPDFNFSPNVNRVDYRFNARMEGVFYNSSDDPYCLMVNAEYDWVNTITLESGTQENWHVFVIQPPNTNWKTFQVQINAPSYRTISNARYRFLRSGYQCSNDGNTLLVNSSLVPGTAADDFMFDNLLLDNLVVYGYGIGTPTPTPTRTTGPTPTETTTPRALWATPTPGTPEPTKQFPPYYGRIPTRIPPISFPDWDWLLIPTPSWHFEMPLIPTPPPLPTRAPFTFTIPISYSTPAAFFPPTAAPTTTATPTVELPDDPCPLVNNHSFDDDTGWTLYYGASISDGHLTLPGPAANAFQTVSFDAGDYSSVISVTSSASTQAWIVINSDNLGVFNPTAGAGLYYATNTNVPAGNYLLAITNVSGGELVIDEMCTSNLAEPTPTLTPAPTATRADIIASMNLVASNLYSEAAVMQTPTTFTIQTAPDDYAPALPRPMADVGYTFDHMQSNIGFLYDPRAWASLFGYMISMPFQLAKFFITLSGMMGPVGLFVKWLLVLLPFVLFARIFIFIKNIIISIINLVIKIIRFIGDIWDLFPGL